MYDWEIQNILKERNCRLESNEYFNICKTSPQINYVKYNPFENCFEVWTDCNHFKFSVYCPENK